MPIKLIRYRFLGADTETDTYAREANIRTTILFLANLTLKKHAVNLLAQKKSNQSKHVAVLCKVQMPPFFYSGKRRIG